MNHCGLKVSEATKEISVHALQISIESASYCAEGGAAVSPELIIFNTKLQTITFRFEDELAVSKAAAATVAARWCRYELQCFRVCVESMMGHPKPPALSPRATQQQMAI